jgi:GT2 family glycosyltransferase
LDLDAPFPPPLDLNDYHSARVILFCGRVPVGQCEVRVEQGRVDLERVVLMLPEEVRTRAFVRALQHHLGWCDASFAGFTRPPATLAVCTHERPDDLASCLSALAQAGAPSDELLVIDNAPSTDAARRVVASHSGVRYVHEARRGLNVARNRALAEARHDIVAFCDDDARADAGWADALVANFGDPRTLCVTGLTLPAELDTEAQETFERYSPFGRGFTRRVFGGGGGESPFVVARAGAGANMALRRSVVDLVGPFDETLDAGTPTRSGGDHEMFSRILAAGYRITYEPAAVGWHRHRREWRELRETIHGYGVGVYAMWTRKLLVDREPAVVKLALSWFFGTQLPALVRALLRRRPGVPLELLVAELAGCACGPRAYFASRGKRAAPRG